MEKIEIMEITFKNLSQMLLKCDVVSFDIFDTLLSRKIGAPVDVFELVRSKLLMDDITLIHHDVMMNYPHLRRQSEQEARTRRIAQLLTEGEITLDEIYAVFQEKTAIDVITLEALKQAELEVEALVLYAPKDGKIVYDTVQQQGKKIVAISDMYLPTEYLHSILSKNGYDIPLEMIFVSAEHRASKHTRQLYKIVENKLTIAPSKWLHIGDNLTADIKNAQTHGIKTLYAHWSSVENIHIPSIDGVNDYGVASIVDFLGTKQAQEFFPSEAWSSIGYKTFGPLLFGFMVWLTSQLKANGIQQALFMARDAQLLKTLYDRFFKNDDITTTYVYGSRQSLYPLSVTDWPMHRIWHLFNGKTKRSVREVLSMLGLDADLHLTDIHQVGFSSADDLICDENRQNMFNLINRFYFPIMQASAKQRSSLNSYFLDIIHDYQKIAVIDIGWNGNIQAAFSRSVVEVWSEKTIQGFYLGLFDNATPNIGPYSNMKGWVTSFANRDEVFHELTGNGAVEILEFVLTANHGSTLRYENIDGVVKPVLENLGSEITYNQNAMNLQSGIIQYFEDHRYLLKNFPLESLMSHEWMKPFLQLVQNPTKSEAEMFGNLTHSDAPGRNSSRLSLAPNVSSHAAKTKNAEYQEALSKAYWKTGFIVRNN